MMSLPAMSLGGLVCG